MPGSYSTHEVPHDDRNIADYATAYSRLRLRGLEQPPDSFSSTYEDGFHLPENQKLARLQNLKRHVIIVAVDNLTEEQPLCLREWAGSVTLIGPLTWEEYVAPLTSRNPQFVSPSEKTLASRAVTHDNDSGQTSLWHMTALYVDENHRRQGLATKLCEAAFDSMKRKKRHDLKELRFIIKPENAGVVHMYENLGFELSPLKATLVEAVVASGEAEIDAETVSRNLKYTHRGGLIMIKRI